MIEKILRESGIYNFGAGEIPKELRPFPALPYALSFYMPYPRVIAESIKNGPTKTYFHFYRTMNTALDSAALKIVSCLENNGKNTVYVPASQSISSDGLLGLFPHKTAAYFAGLGGIGQNDLFLTAKHGCAVRFSTVLTDYRFEFLASPAPNPCTNCKSCVKACPSGALYGGRWDGKRDSLIDAEKCRRFMKEKWQDVGRGSVCGICMAACPVGRD